MQFDEQVRKPFCPSTGLNYHFLKSRCQTGLGSIDFSFVQGAQRFAKNGKKGGKKAKSRQNEPPRREIGGGWKGGKWLK